MFIETVKATLKEPRGTSLVQAHIPRQGAARIYADSTYQWHEAPMAC
jgi:hypothetical protein